MGSLSYPNEPSSPFQPINLSQLPEESKLVMDFIVHYYKTIETYPVQPRVKPGFLTTELPETPPSSPETMEAILKDVKDKIVPGLLQWQSPDFHAYFPATCSNAGIMGEMLCAGLNVVGFTWAASPSSTELEKVVVDWMGKIIRLPSSFLFSGSGGGALYGSSCEAIVCTLVAARDKALEKIGDDKIIKLVVYCSDQTHYTIRKEAKVVGIMANNIRSIPTRKENEFGLSPADLQNAIEKDLKAGLFPFYICGTIGTTSLGAVDPITELGKVARKFGLWFHIDAAYAGSACICPEYEKYMFGVELADSFSMNAHKWLLSNMDCAILWVQSPQLLTKSMGEDGDYLKSEDGVVDYKDWQISVSRRFRAIKLWTIIRRYGVTNLMSHIRSDVSLALRFEGMVEKDERFEIVAPRKFSLVCIRLKSSGRVKNNVGQEAENPSKDAATAHDSRLTRELMERINSSGKAFLSGVDMGRMFFIRCAFGTSLTEERHIDSLWKLIQETADYVLKGI